MKQLPLITGILYTAPWAVLASTHAELSQLYRNYMQGTIPNLPAAIEGREYHRNGIVSDCDVSSGIAVLHLSGVIAKRAPDTLCGPPVIDLAHLDPLIEELTHDSRYHTVILNMDSPGGCMIGLEETCELLLTLGETKRLIAYTDFQMCSACYYLACACDEIYAAPSSCIGSINAYIAAIDSSRAWEMEGFQLKMFRGGELKAIGHPGKAFTAEEETFLNDSALAAAAQFHAWVRQRRGDVPDDALQGQWFAAKAAPSGLIDDTYPSLSNLIGVVLLDAA